MRLVEPDHLFAEAQADFDAGRYVEAREKFTELLSATPHSSPVLRSLAQVSFRLGQTAQAVRYCRQAVDANPRDSEAHFSLALLYLLHGNYEKGWIEYEWRLTREHCVAHRYAEGAALWDGRALDHEALMLHCEQGIGDSLQFIRFLPLVRERVKTIHLACHPELVRLFSGLEGVASIVTDGQPLPPFQFHCPLLSVPRLFNVTLATVPAAVPYLPLSNQSAPKSGRLRVGLVWRASPGSAWHNARSVPLASLRSLAPLPVEWISLQRDPDAAEQKILRDDFHAVEMGSTFRDFKDTAECVETLDLVISVDTSVAHLAGALARPTCILLHRWADWRWLLDRADSPWYPTARLFRQTTEGDWTGPLEPLKRELEHQIATGSFQPIEPE
jgi:hypothetical protein